MGCSGNSGLGVSWSSSWREKVFYRFWGLGSEGSRGTDVNRMFCYVIGVNLCWG